VQFKHVNMSCLGIGGWIGGLGPLPPLDYKASLGGRLYAMLALGRRLRF